MLYLLTIAPIKWIGFRRLDMPSHAIPGFIEEPIGSRALGAHQNGIEAFPFFAIAVLLAEFRGGPQRFVNELAVLFLIVRIAYVLTYLGDRPTLRSILWSLGFAINRRDFLHAGNPELSAGLGMIGANNFADMASRSHGAMRPSFTERPAHNP